MAQLAMSDSRDIGLGLNNKIARELSPPLVKKLELSPLGRVDNGEREQDEHQKPVPNTKSSKEVKYNLWPSSSRSGNSPHGSAFGRTATSDLDRAYALAQGRSSSAMSDRGLRGFLGTASRSRNKEGLSSIPGRRKPSIPELGPMTTVQEAAMDSPTIPGRPPLHERSSSAPAPVLQPPTFFEAMVSRLALPSVEGMKRSDSLRRAGSSSTKRKSPPASGLTPLLIPTRKGGLATAVVSSSCAESSSSSTNDDRPPEPPPKSPRLEGKASPRPVRPNTPAGISSVKVPASAPADTPITAPEERSYPQPWSTPPSGRSPTRAHPNGKAQSHSRSHSQAQTLTDCPVMERGRLPKRADGELHRRHRSNSTKRTASADALAFKSLPLGMRPAEASSKLAGPDLESLQQQAVGQAAQFEVLGVKDVEELSKEIRALDERCVYLRKTHSSLRSGRQDLHARMVTYLTSPRLAPHFSRENILKQEEAMAELDASIDEWVAKLEQAENRRMRVRQKLLEHVAGALMTRSVEGGASLEVSSRGACCTTACCSCCPSPDHSTQPSMMRTTGHGEEDTPPASPGKTSNLSPATPLPPSAAPAEADGPALDQQETTSPSTARRQDVESIKIYADSNMFSMFTDVEREIDDLTSAWGGAVTGT